MGSFIRILFIVLAGVAFGTEFSMISRKDAKVLTSTSQLNVINFNQMPGTWKYGARTRLIYDRGSRKDVYNSMQWSCKVVYQLQFVNTTNLSTTTRSGELFIRFNGDPIYLEEDVFDGVELAGYNKIILNVTQFDPKDISGSTPVNLNANNIPDDIYLELLLDANGSIAIPANTLSYTNLVNGNTIAWPYMLGADSYDLEWAFVDEFDNLPTSADFPFDQVEAVRINTSNQHFDLHMTLPTGKLYYRVRGKGYFENSLMPTYTNWSSTSSIYITTSFESNKNWQYSVTYAEDGMYSKVMTFADGSSRIRQVSTLSSSDTTVLAGGSLYDYEGRPRVNPLPVPETGVSLAYREKLNTFVGGKSAYDRLLSTAGNWPALSVDSKAAIYYSDGNTVEKNYRSMLPDGGGYAYSVAQPTADPTGRIEAQNIPGAAFKMGKPVLSTNQDYTVNTSTSSHFNRYVYGQPDSREMHEMFGTNVGEISHYKKTIVLDANGQASISYMDQEGRVVATCLAGYNPDNTIALENINSQTKTYNLEIDNKVSSDKKSYTSTNTFINEINPTEYTFHYDLQGVINNSSVLSICPTCTYKLSVKVLGPDGIPVLNYSTSNIQANGSCASNSFPVADHTQSFTADMIGTYTIVKTLTLDDQALELLKNQVPTPDLLPILAEKQAENPPLECLPTDQDKQNVLDELNAVDFCEGKKDLMKLQVKPGEAQASTDAEFYANFQRLQISSINGKTKEELWATPSLMTKNRINVLWEGHPEYCIYEYYCFAPTIGGIVLKDANNIEESNKFDRKAITEYKDMFRNGTPNVMFNDDPFFNVNNTSNRLHGYLSQLSNQSNLVQRSITMQPKLDSYVTTVLGLNSTQVQQLKQTYQITDLASLYDWAKSKVPFNGVQPTPDQSFRLYYGLYMDLKRQIQDSELPSTCHYLMDASGILPDPDAVFKKININTGPIPNPNNDPNIPNPSAVDLAKSSRSQLYAQCINGLDDNVRANAWINQLASTCSHDFDTPRSYNPQNATDRAMLIPMFNAYLQTTCKPTDDPMSTTYWPKSTLSNFEDQLYNAFANPKGELLLNELNISTDLNSVVSYLNSHVQGCSLYDIAVSPYGAMVCNEFNDPSVNTNTYRTCLPENKTCEVVVTDEQPRELIFRNNDYNDHDNIATISNHTSYSTLFSGDFTLEMWARPGKDAMKTAFNKPAGIVTDSKGNVFVCDYENHVIRKITPGGVVSTFAGNGSFGWVNGSSSTAQFGYPYDIVVDRFDNIYVADLKSDYSTVVRKITPEGVVSSPTQFGGTGFHSGIAHVNDHILCNASGQIFDSYNILGGFKYYGGYFYGNLNCNGYSATQIATDYEFVNNKYYILLKCGNQYNLIEKAYNSSPGQETILMSILGSADGPIASASMNVPFMLTKDRFNNLYFNDITNNSIRKIDLTTMTVSSIPSAYPVYGLYYDNASDQIYCTDGVNRVFKVSPNGVTTNIAGGNTGYNNTVYNPYGRSSVFRLDTDSPYYPFGIDVQYSANGFQYNIYTGSMTSYYAPITYLVPGVYSYDEAACHHLSMVRKNGKYKFYVNNELKLEYEAAGFGMTSHAALGVEYSGTIDELRIWSDARTEQELQYYSTGELSGYDQGLVGYYKFNEESGQQLTDASSTQNHGFLGNSSLADPFDAERISTSCLIGDSYYVLDDENQTQPSCLNVVMPPGILEKECIADNQVVSLAKAEEALEYQKTLAASQFLESHILKCLSGIDENMTLRYSTRRYQYTLYYYDQAGNLVQTVPPEGVELLGDAAFESDGTYRGGAFQPEHTLLTKYAYNTIGGITTQISPDADTTYFIYDRKGQLRLSQNGNQTKKSAENHHGFAKTNTYAYLHEVASNTSSGNVYSYTHYDALGRIKEVGQINSATENLRYLFDPANRKAALTTLDDAGYPAGPASAKEQVSRTEYDNGAKNTPTQTWQRNLRMRVAQIYVDSDNNGTPETASYFSYDVHGNVDTLTQLLPIIGEKKMYYEYDLISGRMHKVHYQSRTDEQFHHSYSYDSDARLTSVSTSRNGKTYEQDARYFYYKHGPLARVELGSNNVQGLDYYYTLQGWLKGINLPAERTNTAGNMRNTADPGLDGLGTPTSNHRFVVQDEFAMTLNYYNGDYASIGTMNDNLGLGNVLWGNSEVNNSVLSEGLYNGNIAAWTVQTHSLAGKKGNSDDLFGLRAMGFQYDQLQRLKQVKSFNAIKTTGVNEDKAYWTNAPLESLNAEYWYDANGNITKSTIHHLDGGIMDDLEYQYDRYNGKLRSNRLYHVKDQPTNGLANGKYTEDIDDQGSFTTSTNASSYAPDRDDDLYSDNNYTYDELGNLIQDKKEGIEKIIWTVYGKVQEVKRYSTSTKADLEFVYDAMGRRTCKIVKPKDGSPIKYTFYVTDASGNVMSIYQKEGTAATIQTELIIYGSGRLGSLKPSADKVANSTSSYPKQKEFEISDHLGNVRVMVSNFKQGIGSTTADYYIADVTYVTDYYAFGMTIEGRTSGSSRYGFNGQEKDSELHGSYTAEFWQYDPRLGRRWNVDPIFKEWESPYACFANNPIYFIDLLGLTGEKFYEVKKGDTYSSISEQTGVSVENLRLWNGYKDTEIPIGAILNLKDPMNGIYKFKDADKALNPPTEVKYASHTDPGSLADWQPISGRLALGADAEMGNGDLKVKARAELSSSTENEVTPIAAGGMELSLGLKSKQEVNALKQMVIKNSIGIKLPKSGADAKVSRDASAYVSWSSEEDKGPTGTKIKLVSSTSIKLVLFRFTAETDLLTDDVKYQVGIGLIPNIEVSQTIKVKYLYQFVGDNLGD